MPSAVDERQEMEIDAAVGPAKLSKSQIRKKKKKLKKERDSLITGQATTTIVGGEDIVSKKRKWKKSKKKKPTLVDNLNIHQDMEIAQMGSGTSTSLDLKSTVSKSEEYRNIAKVATCDVKSSILKREGCMEVVIGKTDSSEMDMIDVRTLLGEYNGIANGETGSNRTASLDVKAMSKGEENMKIENGETGSNATALDAKSAASQDENKRRASTRKPTSGEILNPQCNTKDMETARSEMHSGKGANVDENGTVSKRRKRRKPKKKKPTVDVISIPHDNVEGTKIINGRLRDTPLIEGLPAQSHVHGCQPMEINIARSLSENLTIENLEILKDQSLVVSSLKTSFDNHGLQSNGTHVATLRKKLLILDVNGLLADIICPPPKDCKSDKNILRRAIFKRPFLDDFLGFCFERFNLGIWSSRTKKILDPVVDYLLGDLKKKLFFLWDISQCTSSRARTLESRHKCIVFKNLRKIWEGNGPNLVWEKEYYNESNTLLLDDSPYKALLNPKHTGIFPLSYSYKDKNDNYLGPNGDLRVYLEGVVATDNVKTYVEQHPFGQRPIDETSPHWAFYSGVLQECMLS